MSLDFLTPDVWNGLVLAVVIIGLALAALRLYADFTRPQGDDRPPPPDERKPAPRPRKDRRSSRRR